MAPVGSVKLLLGGEMYPVDGCATALLDRTRWIFDGCATALWVRNTLSPVG